MKVKAAGGGYFEQVPFENVTVSHHDDQVYLKALQPLRLRIRWLFRVFNRNVMFQSPFLDRILP